MKALTLVSMLLVCMRFAAGADDAKMTVSAGGSAPILPTALQVWVTLKEKGPDAEAAAKNLKAAEAKLEEKLTALGARKEQIGFEPLTIVDKSAAQDIRARMRSGGRLKRTPTAAAADKQEVELTRQVHASLPLEKKDLDGVVVEAELLKTKVKAAKLLEEKADAAEGDEEDPNVNQYDPSQPRGPLQFMFYAARTEEAQGKALSSAIKKAGDLAAIAAKSAGKNGVELHSLTIQTDESFSELAQMRYMYRQYERQGQPPTVPDGMLSQTPQMAATVQVSAEFRFK